MCSHHTRPERRPRCQLINRQQRRQLTRRRQQRRECEMSIRANGLIRSDVMCSRHPRHRLSAAAPNRSRRPPQRPTKLDGRQPTNATQYSKRIIPVTDLLTPTITLHNIIRRKYLPQKHGGSIHTTQRAIRTAHTPESAERPD